MEVTRIVKVSSDEQRRELKIFKQRFFVEELHYPQSAEDDFGIRCKAGQQGATYLAFDADDHVVGTIAIELWHGLNLSATCVAHYCLSRIADHFGDASFAIVRRWAVVPEFRHSRVAFDLVHAMLRFAFDTGSVEFLIIDCDEARIKNYFRMGFKTYGLPFKYEGGAIGVPMWLVLRDHQYLEEVRSTLFRAIVSAGFQDDPRKRLAFLGSMW